MLLVRIFFTLLLSVVSEVLGRLDTSVEISELSFATIPGMGHLVTTRVDFII